LIGGVRPGNDPAKSGSAPRFLGLDRACILLRNEECRIKRFVCLLLAAVHHDAGALIDDAAALNEKRIFLRRAVGVYTQAREPGGSFEMIDRPHGRDFKRAESRCLWKNRADVFGNNAPVIRLREVFRHWRFHQGGRQAARCTASQT
jgi:hypothetical protein